MQTTAPAPASTRTGFCWSGVRRYRWRKCQTGQCGDDQLVRHGRMIVGIPHDSPKEICRQHDRLSVSGIRFSDEADNPTRPPGWAGGGAETTIPSSSTRSWCSRWPPTDRLRGNPRIDPHHGSDQRSDRPDLLTLGPGVQALASDRRGRFRHWCVRRCYRAARFDRLVDTPCARPRLRRRRSYKQIKSIDASWLFRRGRTFNFAGAHSDIWHRSPSTCCCLWLTSPADPCGIEDPAARGNPAPSRNSDSSGGRGSSAAGRAPQGASLPSRKASPQLRRVRRRCAGFWSLR
jgi:hypothetical protein